MVSPLQIVWVDWWDRLYFSAVRSSGVWVFAFSTIFASKSSCFSFFFYSFLASASASSFSLANYMGDLKVSNFLAVEVFLGLATLVELGAAASHGLWSLCSLVTPSQSSFKFPLASISSSVSLSISASSYCFFRSSSSFSLLAT